MFANLLLTTLIHKTGWTRIQKMRLEKRYASTPARGIEEGKGRARGVEGGEGEGRGHISRTFGMCDIVTKFFGLFLSFVS